MFKITVTFRNFVLLHRRPTRSSFKVCGRVRSKRTTSLAVAVVANRPWTRPASIARVCTRPSWPSTLTAIKTDSVCPASSRANSAPFRRVAVVSIRSTTPRWRRPARPRKRPPMAAAARVAPVLRLRRRPWCRPPAANCCRAWPRFTRPHVTTSTSSGCCPRATTSSTARPPVLAVGQRHPAAPRYTFCRT